MFSLAPERIRTRRGHYDRRRICSGRVSLHSGSVSIFGWRRCFRGLPDPARALSYTGADQGRICRSRPHHRCGRSAADILCACELRSPAPFSDDGFRTFNQSYVVTLRDWGVMENDRNPVARSNVCPDIDPPPEASFHAFCFTVKTADAAPSFVISGSGEAREGGASYAERTRAMADKP